MLRKTLANLSTSERATVAKTLSAKAIFWTKVAREKQKSASCAEAEAAAGFLQEALIELCPDLKKGQAKSPLFLPPESPLGPETCEDFLWARWPGLPLSVSRALICWGRGLWSLELMSFAPTPEQLLEKQSQGKRCVTLFLDETTWRGPWPLQKDPFDFFLHDLIHADRFFSHPDTHRGQVRFFRSLWDNRDNSLIRSLAQDPHFRDQWNYLLSDMNTHPEHLMASAEAYVRQGLKRKRGLSAQSRLATSDEDLCRDLFNMLKNSSQGPIEPSSPLPLGGGI